MRGRSRWPPLVLVGLLGSLASAPATSSAAGEWLHVVAESSKEHRESVRIHIPLCLVEAILPLIDEKGFCRGRLNLAGTQLDRADLARILGAVRESEEGVYVTIEDEEGSVRVLKRQEHLLLEAREGPHPARCVRVRAPLAVLEALLSEEGDGLDVLGAVRALRACGEGEIVSVRGNAKEVVRIWIGGRKGPEEGGSR